MNFNANEEYLRIDDEFQTAVTGPDDETEEEEIEEEEVEEQEGE